ncbi:MAG: flagellar biosynthesis protein FlhF [Spirochaetaceae bacterium]|nr:flagellar biosynthesis protein FlhF [Spirochaetaceae bacterium]
MEYFVEQAITHREAEAKIREKYGDHARIMHHRTVRVGGFLGLFSREGVEVTGYFSNEPRTRKIAPASEKNLEEEKKKLLKVMKGGEDNSVGAILDEIRSLKDSLDIQQRTEAGHPTIAHVQKVLGENDFSPRFTARMIERMRRELSVEQLEDQELVLEHLLVWIGESIRLHEPRSSGRPEIFVLVGPTGVGKTTTIAKLAAMYGLDREMTKSRDIRILTIDNYRIGARQQIETYGQIMDVPVSFVESAEEMRKYLALYQEADMIFVDTIGKSPRDFRRLGEMNELLASCGSRARVHLAVSATTKTADVREIATQFEPFKYEAVVVTKLDETTRAGNIISALSEKDKPISFITDGQRVPQDIERATVLRLLTHLEGFGVTRERLDERFGKVPVRSA